MPAKLISPTIFAPATTFRGSGGRTYSFGVHKDQIFQIVDDPWGHPLNPGVVMAIQSIPDAHLTAPVPFLPEEVWRHRQLWLLDLRTKAYLASCRQEGYIKSLGEPAALKTGAPT